MRFYDPLLRIAAWFEDLNAGSITGLSFSLAMPAKVCARDAMPARGRVHYDEHHSDEHST